MSDTWNFDIAAYLAKTRMLTTEQHGAYLLLLMAMWKSEHGKLPNDDKKLARIACASLKRWHYLRDEVMEFFTIDGDSIRHERIDQDRAALTAAIEQKKLAGQASGRSRSAKKGFVKSIPETPLGVLKSQNDFSNQLDLLKSAEHPFPNAHARVDSTFLKEEITGKKQEDSTSVESSTGNVVQAAVESYATLAGKIGLPGIRALNDDRTRKLTTILDQYGLPVWNEALGKVENSHFLRGQNDRGWVANFDFLLQPSSFLKLIEGRYNDRPVPQLHAHSPPQPQIVGDEIDEMIRREREKEMRNVKH
jgi:uncharacterized protein YdaU (DUF1376 family)